MLSILKNKTNIIVIIIIIAGGIYYFYYNGTPSDTSVLGPQMVATSTPTTSDQFLITLKSLKRIKLSGSIFDEQAFNGLQDYNTDFPDQPVGRINPFSPTGGDTGISTATSSKSIAR